MNYITIEKAPTEDLPFEFNFGVGDFDGVFTTDPIDPAACTVKDWSDASVVGLTLGTPAVSGKVVQVRISGGTDGADYQLKVKAVSTTNDYDAEIFALMKVRRPTVP